MYETNIHLATLIDALNIIAESKPGDNYRLTLSQNPLLEMSNGIVTTKNDEFVVKKAEMIRGEMKVNLSIDLTIKAFTETIAVGKALLLKGKNSNPFIRIEIINDQLATIEF